MNINKFNIIFSYIILIVFSLIYRFFDNSFDILILITSLINIFTILIYHLNDTLKVVFMTFTILFTFYILEGSII